MNSNRSSMSSLLGVFLSPHLTATMCSRIAATIVFSLLVGSSPARASQSFTPAHRVYGTADDFSAQIFSIAQDDTGVLWLAMEGGGIASFNGNELVAYTTREGLPSNSVGYVLVSRDRRIWISLMGHPPLWREQNSKGPWHSTPRPTGARFGGDFLSYQLVETSRGRIFLASDVGIFQWNGAGWTLWKSPRDSNGKPHEFHQLLFTSQGATYGVASRGILWQLDPGEPKLLFDEDENIWPTQFVGMRLFELEDGRILVTGLSRGIAELKEGQLSPAMPERSEMPDNLAVNEVLETRDGRLLLGSWGKGIYVFRGGKLEQIYDERHGLGDNVNVHDLFEDLEGNIFATGAGGGLWQAAKSKFTNITKADGLGFDVVWSLNRAGDGSLWVMGFGGMISRLKPDGTHKTYDLKKQGSYFQGKGVSWFLPADSEHTWVYSPRSGAHLLNNEVEIVREINKAQGMPSQNYRNMTIGEDGALIFSTLDRGVVVLRADGSTEVWDESSGLADKAWDAEHYRDGIYAVATDIGVGFYDSRQGKAWIVKEERGLELENLMEVARDPQGTLWFVAVNGVIQLKNEVYKHFTTENGLPHDTVYLVVSDQSDGVWVGTARGVAHIDKEDHVTTYGKFDGMLDLETNSGAGYLDADGTIWFGTISGATGIHPKTMHKNQTPPVPRITEIHINQKPWARFDSEVLPGDKLELNLNPDQRTIRLVYSTASLCYPEAVRFRTRLIGADKDWSPPTALREMTLKNASPGEYVFEVVACNEDLNCSSEPARVGISIEFPFYTRWYFFVLLSLIIGLTAYLIFRIRLEAHVKREAMLAKINTELEDALDRAKESARIKSEFLANTSHELRTPLNTIINIPEGLLEEYFYKVKAVECGACDSEFDIDEDDGINEDTVCPSCNESGRLEFIESWRIDGSPGTVVEYLRSILSSGRHLLNVVEDILDLSKLEAGRMELYVENVKIGELLDGVMDSVSATAQKRRITIDVLAVSDEMEITVDHVKMSQVLINLISNAIKFSKDRGTIEVGVTQRAGYFVFSVRDHGVGISKEDQQIVFDSFRQIDGGHTRQYGGTGLGLSITKIIVEMHGGEVWVESEPGVGSTFFFSVPIHDEKTIVPVTSDREQDTSRRKTILIMDDELSVLETTQLALKSTGYQIETESDPANFIDRVRELKPELVILDIMMPKISGITLLKEIRKDSRFWKQKILVSSAYYTNRSIVSEMGAYWISKPWTRTEMIQK